MAPITEGRHCALSATLRSLAHSGDEKTEAQGRCALPRVSWKPARGGVCRYVDLKWLGATAVVWSMFCSFLHLNTLLGCVCVGL